MSMNLNEFIIKWCGKDQPSIHNKVCTVKIKGGTYLTTVFFIPDITKWKGKSQKVEFWKDAKEVNIIPLPGRKKKWYIKTWE